MTGKPENNEHRGIEMKRAFVARVSFCEKGNSLNGVEFRNVIFNDSQTFADLRKWIEDIECSRKSQSGAIEIISGEFPKD